MDENQKTVNTVYLNYVKQMSDSTVFYPFLLDSADEQLLEGVAYQNPILGGNAVYQARQMLFIDVLDAEMTMRSMQINNNEEHSASFSIYQNFYNVCQNGNFGKFDAVYSLVMNGDTLGAYQLNQLIESKNIPEENQLLVNSIYLRYLTRISDDNQYNDTLENAEIAFLESVAYQHSLAGGPSVWMARAMLRLHLQEPVFKISRGIVYKPVSNKASIASISPNPGKDLFTFAYRLSDSVTDAELQLYDVAGILLKRYRIDARANSLTINEEMFDSGVYIWSLTQGGKPIKTGKLVIAR
jgi:hypothetical protein